MEGAVDYTLERVFLKSKVEQLERKDEMSKTLALKALTAIKNGQYETAEHILLKIIGVQK